MKRPVLSICIPTYNRGGFAKNAVENVLNSWKGDDIEVVVSDNCSQDNTKELLEQIEDHRFSYYRNNENLGAAYNTHLTFMKAKGEYAYLTSDEDDIIISEIPYLINYFKTNPQTSIFIGGGDLRYTKKRFEDRIYKTPFEALKAIAFQTRYMTGIILNQKLYAEKVGNVKFEESPQIWDAYSFMYAMAHLCCYGEVVTSSHLLFNQTRFTMTDISNNARTDGVYYYEPQGRINQMQVWSNTIIKLPLTEFEKKYMVIKIIYDTMMLATRIFTPGYIDEVKKTVPANDFVIYFDRVKSLNKEKLAREIVNAGRESFYHLFGVEIDDREDTELYSYYLQQEAELKKRIEM